MARPSFAKAARRPSFRPNVEQLSDRVVPAGLSGQVFLDTTGNGLSADDTPMGGVTVRLHRDANGDGVVNAGDPLLATRVSAGDGSYSFADLAAGNYLVSEAVPKNHVRTGPTPAAAWAVTLADNQQATGVNFDNFRKLARSRVTDVSYTITRADGTELTVTNLRGKTHEGDAVTVNFRVTGGSPVVVSLVAYDAPGPRFDPHTAALQTIDANDTGTFWPGRHSLTVRVPDNYYQVDFVLGHAIDRFGPAGGAIFYSAQDRLVSADNGGTRPETPPPPPGPGGISGRVFVDNNQDGVFDTYPDPNDPRNDFGVERVTVELWAAGPGGGFTFVRSVVTGGDGLFAFTGLAAGQYKVVATQSTEYADGAEHLGSAGGTSASEDFDNDIPDDPSDDFHLDSFVIDLGAGAAATNYRFTERPGGGGQG